MKSTEMINQALSGMLKEIPYPKKLPTELEQWHCYVLDSGHCIYGVLESEHLQERPIEDSMLPIPVKTVLRGYKVIDDYVFCTSSSVTYSAAIGLNVPSEDIEY
jgi:hypothetical protein